MFDFHAGMAMAIGMQTLRNHQYKQYVKICNTVGIETMDYSKFVVEQQNFKMKQEAKKCKCYCMMCKDK